MFAGEQAIAGTLVHGTNADHGSPEEARKVQAYNDFVLTTDLFDGVADFARATIDPESGELRPEFVPDSTTGGPGDKLHPSRAGYQAMANTIKIEQIAR